MNRVAVDFGTGNTVIATLLQGKDRPDTWSIPGVTRDVSAILPSRTLVERVAVAPSVIHYADGTTLIGAQVLDRGLLEDSATWRWMKRGIAYGVTRRRRTSQGHKGPGDAGADYLRLLLTYLSDSVSFEDDEFTFTAPVEAFETFRDWLARVAESMGLRRVRFLDEATAAVLGYQEVVRAEDRFLVVDFGCGTLDASVVRIDVASQGERKAVQLGQAGQDLGGLDIDRWLAEDFASRHGLDDTSRKRLDSKLLRQAESTKIELSNSDSTCALFSMNEMDLGRARSLETHYVRSCEDCERSRKARGAGASVACLGCILLARDFSRTIRGTIDRALENAAVKCGLRRDDITRVVVTGGTSLVPAVRRLLEDTFEGRVDYQNPFDSVATGACRGVVAPLLQHDYGIESYDVAKKCFEFKPLFVAGTEYPTPRDAVRLWAKGSYDGMTRIGIKIFEVSRMNRRALDVSIVDNSGSLLDASRVQSDRVHVCLNRENPTFIAAEPPVSLARDGRRFLCSFEIDGNRRLLVSVLDNLTSRRLFERHPVVRL